MERRDFFKGAVIGAAGLVVKPAAADAEVAPAVVRPAVVLPTEAQAHAELGYAPPQGGGSVSGSDVQVGATRPAPTSWWTC